MPPLRNATVTTIAPTGTLSIIGACSSGVEPLFALCFARNVMDGERLVEVNPHFEEALRNAGMHSAELMEAVAECGSIQGMDFLPDGMRRVFVTAMDISAEDHLRMQAAFQKYTDNAVSKTVNLPHSATVEDIGRIYRLAFELGCKGVTVYRDGCKSVQVLTTGAAAQGEGAQAGPVSQVRQRPDIVMGFTQKIQTGLGVLYLTVNELDGRPFEVFATIGKSGRSITAKAEAIGRLVSLALRSGVEVRDIVVPRELQPAMAAGAIASRERDARMTLAEAEADISDMLKDASASYAGDPEAMRLRTMHLAHESVKQSGGTLVIPSAFSEGFVPEGGEKA